MAIKSMIFQIFLVGLTERRILFTATDHRGQRHTQFVQTTDKGYNPKAYTAAMQAKIERRLAREEVDAWMKDPRRAPSLEYATKGEYQVRIADQKAELQGELNAWQSKQDTLRDNEGKVA